MADKDDVVEMAETAVGVAAPMGRAFPVSAVYYVSREGLAAGIEEHVGRAAAMGFDAVLAAAPFVSERVAGAPRGDLFVKDFDAVSEIFGGGAAVEWLRNAAAAAHGAGLALLLDVRVGGVAQDAGLIGQNPDWFVHGGEGIKFRFLSAADATVDWWDERLAAWQAAGVDGFRFVGLGEAPGVVWRRLVEGVKARDAGAKCLAWSVGVAPEALAGLRECGFDFAYSSVAWWDFKAGWLNDDAARVRAVAPVMAMPAPPETQGWEDQRAVRGLRLAAAYGAGWMLESAFAEAFCAEVAALNAWRRRHDFDKAGVAEVESSAGARVAVLRRGGLVMVANASWAEAATLDAAKMLPQLGVAGLWAEDDKIVGPGAQLTLAAGELAVFRAKAAEKMMLPVAIRVETGAARIAIEKIEPAVDDGRFPARRVVGELVEVSADLISDGHGKLAAEVLYRAVDESQFRAVPMKLIVNDRWGAAFPLERMGRYVFAVGAWHDAFGTFVDEVTKKVKAGVNVSLEILEGMALVERAEGDEARAAVNALRQADEAGRLAMLVGAEMTALMRRCGVRDFLTLSGERIVGRGAAGCFVCQLV